MKKSLTSMRPLSFAWVARSCSGAMFGFGDKQVVGEVRRTNSEIVGLGFSAYHTARLLVGRPYKLNVGVFKSCVLLAVTSISRCYYS